MSYNLSDIKAELKNNVKDSFDHSTNPSYSDFGPKFDFEKGLDLFLKVILYKCGIFELDGLTKTLIPSLHEAYISKRGDLLPLKMLSSELEPYLKKIAFIKSNGTSNFSNDKSKTLISLYNHLSLAPTTLLSKDFTESALSSLIGGNHFVESLCRSYLVLS